MDKNNKQSAEIIAFKPRAKDFAQTMTDLAISALHGLVEHASNECGITQKCIREKTCEHFAIRDFAEIKSQKLYDEIAQSLLRMIRVRRETRDMIKSARLV